MFGKTVSLLSCELKAVMTSHNPEILSNHLTAPFLLRGSGKRNPDLSVRLIAVLWFHL